MIIVPVHILGQLGKVTVVDVENHLLTKAVEEVSNFSITAKPVFNYSMVMKVTHILMRVDQVVHEHHI